MDELRRVTQLLLNQVSHWSPTRWAEYGDDFYAALRRIAGPERELPRLSDAVLPDQLRVLVSDLIDRRADPAEISRATEELLAVRGTLIAAQ